MQFRGVIKVLLMSGEEAGGGGDNCLFIR